MGSNIDEINIMSKKHFIVACVCGCGMGSCQFAKINTDEALQNLGFKPNRDYRLIMSGAMEAFASGATIFVTTSAWSPAIRNYARENNMNWHIIEIKNFMDIKEYEEKLAAILK